MFQQRFLGIIGCLIIFDLLCIYASSASATQMFSASVSVGSGGVLTCTPGPTTLTSILHPVSVGETCSPPFGVVNDFVGSAGADSYSGHVGGFGNATVFGDNIPPTNGSSDVNVRWQDDSVLITSTNPNATVVNASVNLGVNFSLGGLGAPFSESFVNFSGEIEGNVFTMKETHSTNGDSCLSAITIGVVITVPFGNCMGTSLIPGNITTPIIQLPVGQPFYVDFELMAHADAVNNIFGSAETGQSALFDASNSLDFVAGGPVFNFTDPGFTVNAGDYIVNNRYISPISTSVPEPDSLLLFAPGLLLISIVRRGKRRLGVFSVSQSGLPS